MLCFGMKGKLALRYIRPFAIVKRIGLVANHLTLLPYLAKIYDVFHVSLIRKAEISPLRVLS
jgi:hypothetical protein